LIYLDTPVVLAQVFDEKVAPPAALWRDGALRRPEPAAATPCVRTGARDEPVASSRR
jgi:hypothetical protein